MNCTTWKDQRALHLAKSVRKVENLLSRVSSKHLLHYVMAKDSMGLTSLERLLYDNKTEVAKLILQKLDETSIYKLLLHSSDGCPTVLRVTRSVEAAELVFRSASSRACHHMIGQLKDHMVRGGSSLVSDDTLKVAIRHSDRLTRSMLHSLPNGQGERCRFLEQRMVRKLPDVLNIRQTDVTDDRPGSTLIICDRSTNSHWNRQLETACHIAKMQFRLKVS